MRVLVTGAAGFIGSNVAKALLERFEDATLVGIDNMDAYYDVSLKEKRLSVLLPNERFDFRKGDVSDKSFIDGVFAEFKPEYVLHFAAKVGVRHSVLHPEDYINTNINGFFNILEACRSYPVTHLVYASSSSVYGASTMLPYTTDDRADYPLSLYAATKKSNEVMAHSYSKLYGIPCTGLRFFTVYGPAGRPDMAYFGFTDRLVRGEKIQIFNHGNCRRDFTYIDDIVEGVIRVMKRPRRKGCGVFTDAPYALYNIGNGNPESLLDFVQILQEELVAAGVLPKDHDFEAYKEFVPMQQGDMEETYADTTAFEWDFGFVPSVSLRDGLKAFAQWYAGCEDYHPSRSVECPDVAMADPLDESVAEVFDKILSGSSDGDVEAGAKVEVEFEAKVEVKLEAKVEMKVDVQKK